MGLIASNTQPVHIAGGEVEAFVEAKEVEFELLSNLVEASVFDGDVVIELEETLAESDDAEEMLTEDPELDNVEATVEVDPEVVVVPDEREEVRVDDDNDDTDEEFTNSISKIQSERVREVRLRLM
ncbi:hypothetical protein K491DRAFT_722471 [Lophiostoma macrostomum CBS 122681]|uniref:Uncharacterized protein n=1 Tax=Lophiostoma macrostomum CBS 122681 TaxID=1314788 RepID=A0A6A6SL00_9PLEO|nr:hypothetical protein K491DRAFT_722471 [Lophiostoma macrostomum CBS 122681]